MRAFRVLKITMETVVETSVVAQTPEAAARNATGLDLVRSGNMNALAAKVYYENAMGELTMVRLYSKAPPRAGKPAR